MHFSTSILLLAFSFATSALSQDVTGSPKMQPLMKAKIASRIKCKQTGICGKHVASNDIVRKAKCENGFAGPYPCQSIDLLSHLTNDELGSREGGADDPDHDPNGEGSDVWGWTSADGREFGIFLQTDGSAFVEVLPSGQMIFLGRLPTQTTTSIWRDVKVMGDYAYIGAEAKNHGIQIFDLRKLLDPALATQPKTFNTSTDITLFRGKGQRLGSSHNMVQHPSGNMIIAVGQDACKGGPYFIDVTDPLHPVDRGCFGDENYTHDAQVVTYTGPSEKYKNHTIMFAYNEDALTILDISDVDNVKVISSNGYPGSAYTHQGWLTDDSMTTLLLDDEEDEEEDTGNTPGGHTATYVWDVSDLENPAQRGIYLSPVTSIDHNLYIRDRLAYMSNYASGLRVVNITGVEQEGAKAMHEIAHFDVHPEGDPVEFWGSWSSYIYFKSKNILVNSIDRGAFVVKLQE